MSYLAVCPLSEVQSAVTLHSASHVLTVISPDMPVATPQGIATNNHLTLHFNDIGAASPGLALATQSDIEKLLAFAKSWDQTAPMVVHCWLGVSRSTASAMTIAALLQPDRPEVEIAAELRFLAPFASPNPRIISLADKAMGRDGQLIAAANGIGQGVECWQGSLFEMPVGNP